jgi:hypothetical protein
MAIISEFQEDEAPRQQPQAALASALEQSGGAAVFLQAAINVARQRSDFFSDSSAVSKITAMASAARAQVEAKRKAQESERKVAEAETAAKAAAAPPPPPVRMEKAKSSVEKKDSNVRREYSILFEIDLLRTAF